MTWIDCCSERVGVQDGSGIGLGTCIGRRRTAGGQRYQPAEVTRHVTRRLASGLIDDLPVDQRYGANPPGELEAQNRRVLPPWLLAARRA